MEGILKYFPSITGHQKDLFSQLKPLYEEWNARINVISRQDMEHFYLHHVLFSLAIAKIIQFKAGTRVIDIGTGGGFPGIPLAIFFPEVSFTLLDSIGKKIKVVDAICQELHFDNVTAINMRSENHHKSYDFVLGRAVSSFPDFCAHTRHLVSPGRSNSLPNGILYLTGGEWEKKAVPRHKSLTQWSVNKWFSEDFFLSKKIIHLSFM